MASKPKRQQQLGELLQVKQEPFVLDHYLFERGYLKKSLSSRLECSRFGCFNNAIIANPYKSYTKRVPRCSRILRAILKKFTRRNGRRKVMSSGRKSIEEEVVSEESGFCSESLFEKDESSMPTSSDKCCYDESVLADTLEGLRLSNMTEDETCLGGEFQCHVMANSKQLSPVSVLEQIPQSRKLRSREERRERESETTCAVRLPNKLVVIADSTTLADSLCQLRSHESISGRSITTSRGIFVDDDPMALVGTEKIPSQQFSKSKSVLQQSRQLLLDCVREIVESHVIDKGGVAGPEELGSLILERMKAWDSHIENESNILTSFCNDSDAVEQEWNIGFESAKMELCSEIEDFVAEALINEIVDEILLK